MKFKEREELIASLREFADFLDNNPQSIVLPATYKMYVNLYIDGYDDDGEIDDKKIRDATRACAKVLAPCSKNYSGGTFELTKMFGKKIELSVNADRSAVCKRVVTGTKVIPARTIEERTEEIVEWECDDPILAG